MNKKEKQRQYWETWNTKDFLGSKSHPVSKEYRHTVGMKGNRLRNIDVQLKNIQQLTDKFLPVKEKYEKEVAKLEDIIDSHREDIKRADRIIRKTTKVLELNPIILLNQGRDGKYVHGKIWFWKKGFGVVDGKIKDKGMKTYHKFHLGNMADMNEDYLRKEYGSDWKEELMTKDDWKIVCKNKFMEKMLFKMD